MGRLALLMLAGCWGSTAAPTPRDPVTPPQDPPPLIVKSHRRVEVSRCVRAIDNAIEKFRPDLDKIPGMSAREQQLRDAAVLGCEATGWSVDVTTCFETAPDLGTMSSCRQKLTADQMADLNVRMRDVMNVAVP